MPLVRAAQKQRRRAPLPWLLLLLIALVLCQPSGPSAFFKPGPSAPTSGQPTIPEGGVGETRIAEAPTEVGVDTGVEVQATANDLAEAAEFARALKSLKELASTDKTHTYKWRRYCSEQGINHLVGPAQVGLVDDFLARTSDGSIAPVELAPETLLQKLDEVKEEEPVTWWQWAVHCSSAAFGTWNPTRVPAVVVENFLSQHSDGSLPKVELVSEELAAKLAANIKTDREWRAQWRAFMNEHGFGIKDPKKLPADVAQRFLSEFQPRPRTGTGRSLKGQKVKGGKTAKGVKKVASEEVLNSKAQLNSAVLKLLKRNLGAEDIVYSFGSEQPPFQATVTLSEAVLGSRRSFPGEGGATSKRDAAGSAAAKALEFLRRRPKNDLHNVLVKLTKRNPVKGEDIIYTVEEEADASVADDAAPAPLFTATITLSEAVLAAAKLESHEGPLAFKGEASGDREAAERSAAARACEALKIFAGVSSSKEVATKKTKTVSTPGEQPKRDLHNGLMKLMKRGPVQGEDIIYAVDKEEEQDEEANVGVVDDAAPTPLFTATVTLSEAVRADAKLESHEGPLVFTGEPSGDRDAAERSAAARACAALKIY